MSSARSWSTLHDPTRISPARAGTDESDLSAQISRGLTAEDLLAIVLDGSVLNLEHPVAFAQQVQQHRQPVTVSRLQKDQEIARIGKYRS